jgi:hypothetical protein
LGRLPAGPIVFISVLAILSRSGGESEGPPAVVTSTGPRAAIVDQLGLTQPNPTFVETATDLLEQAGYSVDYYPGEKVTVEFYRTFPAQPNELIILRVHSALGWEYLPKPILCCASSSAIPGPQGNTSMPRCFPTELGFIRDDRAVIRLDALRPRAGYRVDSEPVVGT